MSQKTYNVRRRSHEVGGAHGTVTVYDRGAYLFAECEITDQDGRTRYNKESVNGGFGQAVELVLTGMVDLAEHFLEEAAA